MGPAKLAHDRWATLCALEVLKLIADQVERHGSADSADVEVVLLYLRDIAHPCLDIAEKLLLLPLLEIEIDNFERGRVGTTLENYRRLAGLFNEVECCHREGRSNDFVTTCHHYAAAFGDCICQEELFWRTLSPVSDQAQIRSLLAEFEQVEIAKSSQIQSRKSALRKLEAKYVSPHCI